MAAPALSGRTLLTRHARLIRYFLIGGIASLIDILVFLTLYNLVGTSVLLAHSISVPSAVAFSFLMNARHNFRTTDLMALRLASFAGVCLIGYGIGYGIIDVSAAAGLGENIGKVLSLPFVFVIQYLLNSRITFRPRAGPAQ
jgi:putative flippase GtrA